VLKYKKKFVVLSFSRIILILLITIMALCAAVRSEGTEAHFAINGRVKK